jgi:molybdopterin-containing oxidoreductase family membrane subunit
LILEIVICGFVPAFILITKKGRKNSLALWIAVILAVVGVCINRWVMVLQVMAVPVMSFDYWAMYFPSWQEIATTILPVAYGIILVGLAHRYLPVFPNEPELNPIETLPAEEPEEKEPVEPSGDLEQELTPAEA